MTVTAPATPAATVLIIRPGAAGASDPLDVLMVQRAAGMGFAGGAMVFPGGKIDPADADPDWLALCDGSGGLEDWDVTARIAAIRETFEEAGIVLARGPGGRLAGPDQARRMAEARGQVEAEAGTFRALMMAEGLRPALDLMVPFARWVPPEGLHKRFDTHFFITAAPEGQEALQDGNEATHAVWTSPQVALAARASGAAKIIFPTACNLGLLSMASSVEDALAQAAARPRDTVQPRIEPRDGRPTLVIPTHLGYPVTEETIDGPLGG